MNYTAHYIKLVFTHILEAQHHTNWRLDAAVEKFWFETGFKFLREHNFSFHLQNILNFSITASSS